MAMPLNFYTPEATMVTLGLLLLATVFAGETSSRFGVPALIGFLLLGMLAGVEGPGAIAFEDYLLTQGIGTACLALILFSGGLDTQWKAVRPMVPPALVLATAGVVITTGVIALSAWVFFEFPPLQAFLLGAVVASTDAAAVFAILRATDFDLDAELPALLELESGSNDPMAIFLVGAGILFAIDPATSALSLVPSFLQEMAVGAATGLAVGWLLPTLLRRPVRAGSGLAFVVPIAGAMLGFGIAALLGGNGFLAVYLAGLVMGSRAFAAKASVRTFQGGLAWLAQVIMFLTLGLLVTPSNLFDVVGRGIELTLLLMFVARPLAVFICLAPFRRFGWRTKLFISWAGLRGAVPIVLATFIVGAGVPGAFRIFNIVFFVVLLSSAVQGTTISLVAGWLKVRDGDRKARHATVP